MSEADRSGNVGLAFGMVTGAGLCTSLGAALAFVINLEVSPVSRPVRESHLPAAATDWMSMSVAGSDRLCWSTRVHSTFWWV